IVGVDAEIRRGARIAPHEIVDRVLGDRAKSRIPGPRGPGRSAARDRGRAGCRGDDHDGRLHMNPGGFAPPVPPYTLARRDPAPRSVRAAHRTNTFGISASGSPRRKTWSGAASACSTRGLPNPSSAPSVDARSLAPSGLVTTSRKDFFGG